MFSNSDIQGKENDVESVLGLLSVKINCLLFISICNYLTVKIVISHSPMDELLLIAQVEFNVF